MQWTVAMNDRQLDLTNYLSSRGIRRPVTPFYPHPDFNSVLFLQTLSEVSY